MRVINALKHRVYLLLSLGISAAFFFIYVYLQIQGIMENFFFWFTTIPVLNLAVFTVFTILLGISFSFQVYLLRNPKVCAVDVKKGTGAATSLGLTSFFISVCPACASLGLFVLPASVLAFLVSYGIYINLVATALLLFVINYLGGFKK
jgi:hypothetical protein